MNDSVATPVFVGLAVGIAFIILFSISTLFLFREYLAPAYPVFPNEENYIPLLQLKISGLKEQYRTDERIDFSVVLKAGGCTYPGIIMIKDLEKGTVIWQFNGTSASSLLFCPIVTNPAGFSMTWQTQYNVEPPITINQTGSYAVIAKHLHRTVQDDFIVIEGSKVVAVTIPEGSSLENSEQNNFEPAVIKVVIGINNTVGWINEDTISIAIVADDKSDPAFYDATYDDTNDRPKVLLEPGEIFEFTFTRPGEFGYHGEPQPWKHGTVIVLHSEK